MSKRREGKSGYASAKVWGKQQTTFYVCPPVFKYEPGKVTLVKAK